MIYQFWSLSVTTERFFLLFWQFFDEHIVHFIFRIVFIPWFFVNQNLVWSCKIKHFPQFRTQFILSTGSDKTVSDVACVIWSINSNQLLCRCVRLTFLWVLDHWKTVRRILISSPSFDKSFNLFWGVYSEILKTISSLTSFSIIHCWWHMTKSLTIKAITFI